MNDLSTLPDRPPRGRRVPARRAILSAVVGAGMSAGLAIVFAGADPSGPLFLCALYGSVSALAAYTWTPR